MTTAAECASKFPDDATVGCEVMLLRRIPRHHIVPDIKQPLGVKISSAAFEDDKDGDPMSVYRLDVIRAEGDSPDRVMVGHEGFALASVTAGLVRAQDQTVHPAPLFDESSHTKICGHKTKGVRRHFAAAAVWVIPPRIE